MITVLLIDRAWPLLTKLIHDFYKLSKDANIKIIFLSEFKKSGFLEGIEVINIHEVPQNRSLLELQDLYQFSIHKSLVTERSFYDYCSFRRSQCYSRLTESEIAKKITPYANALDYLIRTRVDVVIDWIQDSFVPSLAGPIAKHYKKEFVMFLPHYWWTNGALVFDQMDQTSSRIHDYYDYYYKLNEKELFDIKKLDNIFATKKTLFVIKPSRMYSFKDKLILYKNRLYSYEPISIRNFIIRRISSKLSWLAIKFFITRKSDPGGNPFLIYPLQTSPEASLLGTLPEVADQFHIIKNISMNLPYGVKLCVKEHPFDKPGQGLNFDFFRRVQALPNVTIIKGNVSLNNLMDRHNFIALASINGTSIIEAAIKRKPVFIFGRSFYGYADCFFKPNNFDEFYSQLISVLRGEFIFNEKALYSILMALDKSVIRADVNLNVDNSSDLLMQLPKIWLAFLKEFNSKNTTDISKIY